MDRSVLFHLKPESLDKDIRDGRISMVAEPIRQPSRIQRYSIFAPLPPNTRKAGVRTSSGFQRPCQSPCQLMPEHTICLRLIHPVPDSAFTWGFSISSPRSEAIAFHFDRSFAPAGPISDRCPSPSISVSAADQSDSAEPIFGSRCW